MHEPSSPRGADPIRLLVAAIPVLVVLALLVPVVDVDPIAGVTFSNSPFTDEAWYAMNARNWALFGTPVTDEWVMWVLTVPFTVVDAVVFRLFGVGIVQARLVDIACVAITTGLLGFGLSRPFGYAAALVSAIGYGTSSLVLFYGRMAYLEPMAGLFLAAGTLTILAVDGRRAGRWGIVGGIALALAVGTKATVLPAALAPLAIVGVAALRSPGARRWIAGAGLTLAVTAAAWGALILLPNRASVGAILDRYPGALAPTIGGLISKALSWPRGHNDHAIRYMAPLLAAAAGGVLAAAVGLRAMSVGTRLLIAASLAGFVVGLGGVVLGVGGANRYVVFLIPLLAILAAPLSAAIIRRVGRPPADGNRLPRRMEWGAAAVLAILLAAQGVILHASWMRDGTRQLVAFQAEAARLIPPGTVVAGGYASLLAMTSDARAIVPCCQPRPVNAGDLYEAGARMWANSGPPTWAAAHQAAWDARRPLVCLTWGRTHGQLCLLQLP